MVVVEWETVADAVDEIGHREHVIVLDPPFRGCHLQAVSWFAQQGATVHLLYGEEERASTARLLRYQLHPRFAMVCLYRAMQTGLADIGKLFDRASALAWAEAKVVLTTSDLERAHEIVSALDLEHDAPERARLEARDNTVYREAETDYEECAVLCLTL
jgi:hypothetical protein